ncbi:hypothetical protein LTR97_011516 [Elasticomyces elasticus]|uniref:DUF7071 domain-containing protein n=1 Tax=Elasticomyces elasticus TaxID=574655 RepID=A0AAN7VWW8_9PEZI|nr:hypothetical protein LTR97_011516 [Elasticomyces elasticus]
MGYTSVYRVQLDTEKTAHIATREQLHEALQTAQYLKMKVESLRNFIADLTLGTELKIPLDGYCEELEEIEARVLAYAADPAMLAEIRPTKKAPRKKQQASNKRRKVKHTPSDATADLMASFSAHESLTVNPADLCITYPTPPPEVEFIDPLILERNAGLAKEVLGEELMACPVAVRILQKAEELTREQMERMKWILEGDGEARERVEVFAEGLFGFRGC